MCPSPVFFGPTKTEQKLRMKNNWEHNSIALKQSGLTIRKPAIIAAVYTLSIFAPPIRTRRFSTFRPTASFQTLAPSMLFSLILPLRSSLPLQRFNTPTIQRFGCGSIRARFRSPTAFAHYLIIIRYLSHNVTVKSNSNLLSTRNFHRKLRSTPKTDHHISWNRVFGVIGHRQLSAFILSFHCFRRIHASPCNDQL